FTPSNFDITAYAAPGSTHAISVAVKGRGALKASNGRYLVPDAADWSEAVPQGIFRSAFLRTYLAVYVSDTFVRTSVANKTLINVLFATDVRTNVSLTYTARYVRRNADRKIPCGTASDQSAASGTRYRPLDAFNAPRPFTATLIAWVLPGAA